MPPHRTSPLPHHRPTARPHRGPWTRRPSPAPNTAHVFTVILTGLLLLLCGCEGLPLAFNPDAGLDPDAGPVPNEGWVGGPCASPLDCDYDDASCLTQDHPDGMCSLSCDRLCPDRDGANSVTFCVSDPDDPASGMCLPRCDTTLYPGTGCRTGYTCRLQPRHTQPDRLQGVCIPTQSAPAPPPNQTTCQAALTQAGVVWSPWPYTTQSPQSGSNSACTVDDPIVVQTPIAGVQYQTLRGTSPTLAMSCELAMALVAFGDILRDYDIRTVTHLGTFNCRTIANSSRLSQHAHGRAIDVWGFTDASGQDYVLERDWQHDTASPTTARAQVLYELAQRLHDAHIFNTILTPNYNAGHDNHFHLDLRPNAHFLGHTEDPWHLGANPGGVCPPPDAE